MEPQGSTDPIRVELLKKRISGWLRQSRYRARKAGVMTEVKYEDIIEIYESQEYKCIYCGADADSPDHPFPIKERGPCVPANIVPCCDVCRNKKKNRNLVEFYQDKNITDDKLQEIIKFMLSKPGSEYIRNYLKNNFVREDQDQD